MKKTVLFVLGLSLLLTCPAWACDMGRLGEVLLLALAVMSSICALAGSGLGLLARPARAASPWLTLLVGVFLGATSGVSSFFLLSNAALDTMFGGAMLGAGFVGLSVAMLAPSQAAATAHGTESNATSPSAAAEPGEQYDSKSEWRPL